jgi:hypothetical protein
MQQEKTRQQQQLLKLTAISAQQALSLPTVPLLHVASLAPMVKVA